MTPKKPFRVLNSHVTNQLVWGEPIIAREPQKGPGIRFSADPWHRGSHNAVATAGGDPPSLL